jgi:hypothetical protein
MRLCAALALVLVALVAVTVKAWRRPHARRATPADVADVTESRRNTLGGPGPPGIPSWRRPPIRARRATPALGHLYGRALAPPGRDPTDLLPVLSVTAHDGAHIINALTTADGRFEFHVPPGRYSLLAYARDAIGELHDVVVQQDGEREVTIPLGPSASIGGRLRAPGHAAVEILLHPTDSDGPKPASRAFPHEGKFLVDGLMPGRRYDAEFSGDDVRTLKLTGVQAPLETMDVVLEPRAVIRLAFGFRPGGRCPIDMITLHKNGDTEMAYSPSDEQCHFELTAPLDEGIVPISATGDGWLLRTEVAIPAHGAPAPICLNPPCRAAEPIAPRGRARVAFDGAPDQGSMGAKLVPVDAPGDARLGCGSSGNGCSVDGLSPGKTYLVTASGPRCRDGSVKWTIVAGDNDIRIPCDPVSSVVPADDPD